VAEGISEMNHSVGAPFHKPGFVRFTWFTLMLIAIAFIFAAIPGYLTGFPYESLQVLNASPGFTLTTRVISSMASLGCALLCLSLATFLFLRKQHDRMAIFISFYLILYAVLMSGLLVAVFHATWLSGSMINTLQTIFTTIPTVILLCTFPNGRLVPGWTKWLVIGSILVVLLILINPTEDWTTYSTPYAFTVAVFLGAILVSAMYAQVSRYRHVLTSTEKVQVKWVVTGLFVWMIYLFAVSIPWFLLQNLPSNQPAPWWVPFAGISWWLSLMILPLFLTIAILRYRLFDIDVIIRKTLVYAALTVTLAVVFFGGVILLQRLLGPFTGVEDSPVAIVISTLSIAALFTPLRRRIQNDIDRRFYRKKYDAQKTLESFAASVRDAVELEDLTRRLLAVVEETMQPEKVGLWLKQTKNRK